MTSPNTTPQPSQPKPLTYAEAAALYPLPQFNPRWVACHAAFGRAPKSWEFMSWVGEQWRAFDAAHGIKASDRYTGRVERGDRQRVFGDDLDATFDAWLIEALS